MVTPADNATSAAVSGYAEALPVYQSAGWDGVLPFRPATKFPPPDGCTGKTGRWPTEIDYAVWREQFYGGSLGLRLGQEVEVDGCLYIVIGIDVDAYDGKNGLLTIAEGEKRWGPLPPTLYSTSRTDGSRIRLYLIPTGIKLHGVLKFRGVNNGDSIGDVEIVQFHHRYMLCWPSIHNKTREMYRWYDADGVLMDGPPRPQELAILPEPWVEGLRIDSPHNNSKPTGEKRTSGPKRERSLLNVTAAMTAGQPSDKVAQRLALALSELAGGLSRHDTMLGHVMALLRMGYNGEPGVEVALRTLYVCFVRAVAEDRVGGEPEAEAEFLRMITNAEDLLAEEPPRATEEEDATKEPTTAPNATPETDAAFWDQRDSLRRILAFARARGVAPYAVLGAELRRVIALTESWVQLPPTVGSNASVNLFCAPVGASAQGKDIANDVARDAMQFVRGREWVDDAAGGVGIGSGEGLARLFKGYGGDDEPPRRINLAVNEISTLGALADRKGATLVGELLKAYMGQSLGFSNNSRSTSTYIAPHSYRLCLSVGVQPDNGGILLERDKDGLPQRFLWLPTIDPFAPEPDYDAEYTTLEPWEVQFPTFERGVESLPYLIHLPATARRETRRIRHLINIGSTEINPLDGHLNLTRLKAAFGLALLESRADPNDDDWRIAGQLIAVSNRTRAQVLDALTGKASRVNIGKAHAQADRQIVIEERLTEDVQDRVWKTIVRKLQRVGQATRRDLQRACDSKIARDFSAVFDYRCDQRDLVVDHIKEDTAVYRLGDGI